jgi:hypothetical protein
MWRALLHYPILVGLRALEDNDDIADLKLTSPISN